MPRIPMRRWGQGEDFGGIAVYLMSSAARYHTGDTFVIDGELRCFEARIGCVSRADRKTIVRRVRRCEHRNAYSWWLPSARRDVDCLWRAVRRRRRAEADRRRTRQRDQSPRWHAPGMVQRVAASAWALADHIGQRTVAFGTLLIGVGLVVSAGSST
jgi:hypothetical protein